MGKSSQPTTSTDVVVPPNPDAPLTQQLVTGAERMLDAARPFENYGPGYQKLPQAAFGQVYVPGPNQTLFGNPYSTAGAASVYGAGAAAPDLSQFGIAPQPGGAGANGSTNPFNNLWNGGYQPQGQFGFGWAGGGGYGGPPTAAPPVLNPQPTPTAPPTATPAAPKVENPPPAASPNPTGGQNQQQAPMQPPSGATAPDPWAGTNNARTQNNPGTNWTPQGTYNANGPYYSPPPVGADGKPPAPAPASPAAPQQQQAATPDWSQILQLLQGGQK